jgi:hypothetical protein
MEHHKTGERLYGNERAKAHRTVVVAWEKRLLPRNREDISPATVFLRVKKEALAEVPARGLQVAQQMRHVDEPLCDQVTNLPLALPRSIDAKQ